METQRVKHDMMNSMLHYDQMDYTQQLHNDNYHKMVRILFKIVKNFNPFQIEAPEYYNLEKGLKGQRKV